MKSQQGGEKKLKEHFVVCVCGDTSQWFAGLFFSRQDDGDEAFISGWHITALINRINNDVGGLTY